MRQTNCYLRDVICDIVFRCVFWIYQHSYKLFSLTHSLSLPSDPLIQRKQRDYRDPSSQQQQQKSQLHEDLSEIQNIMKKNIDEILNRGEKLDHVASISQDLKAKSKDFKWGTKKLTWQARLQQYGPVALSVFIVLAVLYVKIFGF